MEENKQQQHYTVLRHKEEEPVALKDILNLHREVTADIELKIRNEDNNFKQLTTYCGQLEQLTAGHFHMYFILTPGD